MVDQSTEREHTTPEARLWIGHVAGDCEGCTIRSGGRVMCAEGARLYQAMLPDAVLVPVERQHQPAAADVGAD